MDLTPRLLTEVEFREQWRGYSPNDVDEFLERVAAGVGELLERLRESNERAQAAERRLLEHQDDDEVRRTLVLAQRTATSAVEEARAQAERIVSEAEERANRQLAEAEARLAEAESDVAERARQELGELAAKRSALQADVAALGEFVDTHRSRLRSELERQLADLDRSHEELTVPPPPEVSDVDIDVPEPAEVDLPRPEPLAPVDVAVGPSEEEVAQARGDLAEALRRAGAEELPEEGGPVLFDDDSGADADVDSGEEPASAGEDTGAYEALDDPTGEESSGGSGAGDDDPVQWREPAAETDDDPFLTELRRAVTDTEPLGPRDQSAAPEAAVQHAAAVPSQRRRRRKGR